MQFEQAGIFIKEKLKQELPAHLTYHSIDHIMDVHSAAQRIGEQENIDAADMKLLLTAALYHDAGFLARAEGHEEISCEIAQNVLPCYDYSADEIARICTMIRATRVPQKPENHLAQILADADLDYLGRDDFFSISHLLFTELSAAGVINDENKWNELQVKFMESHQYFTTTSINARQAKKDANLAQIKALINKHTTT